MSFAGTAAIEVSASEQNESCTGNNCSDTAVVLISAKRMQTMFTRAQSVLVCMAHMMTTPLWTPLVFAHRTKAEAADAATAAVKQRNSSSDWSLTEDEGLIVTRRVCGVADNLSELRFMLATVVGR